MSSPIARLALIVVLLAAAFVVLGPTARPVAAQPPIDDLLKACGTTPDNPYLVTTCFTQGRPGLRDVAVVAFRDTPDNSGHVGLATGRQVGAVYGLAYHAGLETIYVAAFHKRGVPFGPAGPGGIYAINLRTGAVSTWAKVPNPGKDTHSTVGNYFPDSAARFGAGTTSLGDLDVSEDGTELAVMNLNDRRIYRFQVPSGEALGSFAAGGSTESWAKDARPFGLAYHNGKLYHGVVRTAQSSQNPDELQGFVYESAPDGGALRVVASTGLRYERGFYYGRDARAIWNPWVDPPGHLVPNQGRYAMPLLSDIVFTPGDTQMILGFRDRFGDETFYTTPPNQPPPGENFYNTPAGDIVPAFPDGDHWRIQVSPEYYTGDFGPTGGGHDETSYGGLAMLTSGKTVAMTANSPLVISSAGAVWLSIAAGSDSGREEIYKFGTGDNFGKANGLGDLEVICSYSAQDTPTPQATETATSTPLPSVTATATELGTATPTATVQLTPSPTTGPSATSTRGPSPTATTRPSATATLAPGVTPSRVIPSATHPAPTATTATGSKKKTQQQATPAPGTTPQIPLRLPGTGGGAGVASTGLPLIVLIGAALAAALALLRRRPRGVR